MKKYIKLLISPLVLATLLFGIVSCEEETNSSISAIITDFSPEILRGDSATVTLKITGGEPPFAFRYKYLNADNVYLYRNVIDIPSRDYTIKLAPTSDITYEAESIASYFNLIGEATGVAHIEVSPVTYRFAESIPASKAAFMQKSRNELTYTTSLQLRNTNGSNFERTVFFEFDISQFTELKDKSRYILKFWLEKSHSVGLNKESTMDVRGILGELDPNLTWDTQPATVDLTPLFSKEFKTTSTADQIEFEGNIDALVYAAVVNGSDKFTIVVREAKADGTGSTGYYFIASDTYAEEAKRPVLERLNREKL